MSRVRALALVVVGAVLAVLATLLLTPTSSPTLPVPVVVERHATTGTGDATTVPPASTSEPIIFPPPTVGPEPVPTDDDAGDDGVDDAGDDDDGGDG